MKKVLIGIIISILFTASFSFHQTFAWEKGLFVPVRKTVILFMQGDVKIKEAGLTKWIDAKEGMVLSGGDKLKTGFDSWAEIGIGKNYKNAVRIQELTLLELADLCPIKINLLKGELRSLVEKLGKDETFKIKTPTSVCSVRGTGWDTNTDGKKVAVNIYEGEVYFAGVSQEGVTIEDPIINAGKRAILEDPWKPIVIDDIPPEMMQDWKKWKEDFLKRRDIKKNLEKSQKTRYGIIRGKQITPKGTN